MSLVEAALKLRAKKPEPSKKLLNTQKKMAETLRKKWGQIYFSTSFYGMSALGC
jgi:hypothetical protein